MNRLLLPILILSIACATTAPVPASAPAPPAAAASAPPCNAGHSILNATLWFQSSAEYRAVALQTYATARRALDEALNDPSWVGAIEETGKDPAQPPAVILDLDETAFDNTGYEARAIRAGTTYDKPMWKKWTSEGAATATPGAAEFLAYAHSRGVKAFYITNRDEDEAAGTLANVKALGFPLDPDADMILQRGEHGWTTSDKTPRRAFVARSYRVVQVFGDDLNDFADALGKTTEERDAIVARAADWWGTRWFMLPNPMYGSWENAAIGAGGTPCERVQRKVDVLK